jgi:SH3-like domain-containing protein
MRATSLFSSIILLFLAIPAAADPPHYASIRRDQAFLREGPSYEHKVLWVYQRKDYPLRVLESYDAWRRVKDVDGTVGWMHHTQLSEVRTALFVGSSKSVIHAGSSPSSKIVAFVQPGVVAKLKACKPDVCEVETSGVDGWVDRKTIWGVDAGEVFQ